jgi:micrococcal nuclease
VLISKIHTNYRKISKVLTLLFSCLILIALIIDPTILQKIEKETKEQTADALGTSVENDSKTYLVTRVIDGDTIEIESGQKVRYIGIDTPEKGDCFENEATQANTKLVLNKHVSLEKDVSETDRYGRLLRYVYVGDIMINKKLVEEGYAVASSYPPDIKYQEQLRLINNSAILNGIGLWGSECKQAI